MGGQLQREPRTPPPPSAQPDDSTQVEEDAGREAADLAGRRCQVRRVKEGNNLLGVTAGLVDRKLDQLRGVFAENFGRDVGGHPDLLSNPGKTGLCTWTRLPTSDRYCSVVSEWPVLT